MDALTQTFDCMNIDSDVEYTIESESDDEKELFGTTVDYKYTVLSIDIGVLHLGMSVGLVSESFELLEIAWVDMVDITKYTHQRKLNSKTCDLYHSRSVADWMTHLFAECEDLFESVDFILIERQPPMGLVAVEQIIYYQWRDKCHLVSPNSMHKYFNIGKLDYEKRKDMTMKIATEFYCWHERAIANYNLYSRKHDISDSICLMLYWLQKQRNGYLQQKRVEQANNMCVKVKGMTADDFLEQFRYIHIDRKQSNL